MKTRKYAQHTLVTLREIVDFNTTPNTILPVGTYFVYVGPDDEYKRLIIHENQEPTTSNTTYRLNALDEEYFKELNDEQQ